MADQERMGLIAGIKANYKMTKAVDRWLPLILLGWFLLTGAVGFAVAFLLTGDSIVFGSITAFLFGLTGLLVVLSRRSQRAMYKTVEAELGAAGRVLNMLRRGWKVEAPVAINKQQDLVHRVIGPPGIVLVGEGNPNRVRPMMLAERRKHERVLSDTPVTEVYVGYGEGEVPLNKLVRYVMKLPKAAKPAQITDILARLRALDAQRGTLPIPKGPMPTSMKGFRGQMRGR
ncbi:MAG TPA: DUF4191 domain-containing protein [Nocardioidaceae bacterium]|nr:DUF4191 domain-containing protein [Nocardioidaceae bacterium]